jgi:RNA polymerase sigma-70 factor (ECF subfamily)
MTESTWQEHYPRVLRFVQSRLHDAAAAADLTQEVFLKAHTRLGSLQDPTRLQPWLFSIAHRAVLDYQRQHRRQLATVAPTDEAVAPEATWDNYLDHPCAPTCVNYIFDQLPAHHRAILELAEVQQIPQRVIAEQLGVPYPTVKSQVQRARAHLRRIVLECCAISTDRYGNVLEIKPKSDPVATAHQAAIRAKCPVRTGGSWEI